MGLPEGKTSTNVYMPTPLYEKLRDYAFRHRITQSEVVSLALDVFLEGYIDDQFVKQFGTVMTSEQLEEVHKNSMGKVIKA